MESDSTSTDCLVIGSGWAGLSCAYDLCRSNHNVVLLESAKQIGGRARRIPFGDNSVDNGQHILIGAYTQTLDLINQLNDDSKELLHRIPLELNYRNLNKQQYTLKTKRLFPPLNMLIGLIRMHGLSLKDKWRALTFGSKLFTNSLRLAKDISVKDLLSKHKQTNRNISLLWEPICLASLNTHIDTASAKIFINVLKDTFCHSRHDSDLIIPKCDLSELLPDRIYDYIEQHGASVKFNQRVIELVINNNKIIAAKTESETYYADHIVLAIPPNYVHKLIKPHAGLDDIAYNLSAFNYNPICTIYIRYPDSVKLTKPIQGFLDMTCEWVVDRRITAQKGLLAFTISGHGPHMSLSNDELIEKIENEIKQLFPDWPSSIESLVVREKRATFDCCIGIDMIRPDLNTPIEGLWLAGDYIQSRYPATIEAAVQSGRNCANAIKKTESK